MFPVWCIYDIHSQPEHDKKSYSLITQLPVKMEVKILKWLRSLQQTGSNLVQEALPYFTLGM